MQWSFRRVLKDAAFAWGSLLVVIPLASLLYAFLVVSRMPEMVQIALPFGMMVALLIVFHSRNIAGAFKRVLPRERKAHPQAQKIVHRASLKLETSLAGESAKGAVRARKFYYYLDRDSRFLSRPVLIVGVTGLLLALLIASLLFVTEGLKWGSLILLLVAFLLRLTIGVVLTRPRVS